MAKASRMSPARGLPCSLPSTPTPKRRQPHAEDTMQQGPGNIQGLRDGLLQPQRSGCDAQLLLVLLLPSLLLGGSPVP